MAPARIKNSTKDYKLPLKAKPAIDGKITDGLRDGSTTAKEPLNASKQLEAHQTDKKHTGLMRNS